MRRSALSPLAIGLLCLFLACESDRHPANSGHDSGFTLSGVALEESGLIGGIPHVTVTLRGDSVQHTMTSGRDGRFSFLELNTGLYVLKASKKNYTIRPDSMVVSIPDDTRKRRCFWGMTTERYRSMQLSGLSRLFGRVMSNSDQSVASVNLNFCYTDRQGYFTTGGNTDRTIILAPRKEHWVFFPDSLEIIPDEPIEIIEDFIAVYSGPPVYSICGKVFIEGEPASNMVVDLNRSGKNLATYWMRDLSGEYHFSELEGGRYTLVFRGDSCVFDSDSLTVSITDRNVAVPDVHGIHHGATWYDFSGRVISRDGKPISGARIHLGSPDSRAIWCGSPLKTDSEGFYGEVDCLRAKGNTPVTFIPKHDTCIFAEDSVTITLEWRDHTPHGGTISIPDFIATDYTSFFAPDYFSLSASSSWIYSRTVNLLPSAEYVIAVSGGATHEDKSYRKMVPAGPAGLTEYRLEQDRVGTYINGDHTEFLRFGVVPGTTWQIGMASGMYPITGTFLGLETVSVPAGTFPDCLKYQVRKEYGSTSHETYTLWLARDTGMVRSEKVLVNYGEEKERVVDELK